MKSLSLWPWPWHDLGWWLMVLRKILDQYVWSYQRWIKSVVRLRNNEVLKTLKKTLTFVDANAAADAEGSTISLHERCSGELKWYNKLWNIQKQENVFIKHYGSNYMLSLKHALTVIFKHQKWLSSKVEWRDTIRLTIMPKPHADLHYTTTGPVKFQIGRYKTAGGAAYTRHPRMGFPCPSKTRDLAPFWLWCPLNLHLTETLMSL